MKTLNPHISHLHIFNILPNQSTKRDRMTSLNLRLILTANAIFSLLSGLGMAIFASDVSEWLGLTDLLIIQTVGIGVAIFSIHIAISARRTALKPLELKYFALMDMLWVIGSGVLLFVLPLPQAGFWLVIGAALIVADFGILEILGIGSLAIQESA